MLDLLIRGGLGRLVLDVVLEDKGEGGRVTATGLPAVDVATMLVIVEVIIFSDGVVCPRHRFRGLAAFFPEATGEHLLVGQEE